MEQDQNPLFALAAQMTATHWIVLGVLLLILEVVTGTTYILWVAASALIVGVAVFILPLSWPMQFLLFFILSAGLLIFGHKVVRPRIGSDEEQEINNRAKSMVGMRVRAVADFDTGRGRVHVGDTQWRAYIDNGDPKAGDEMRVVSVKGTTLEVAPLEPRTES